MRNKKLHHLLATTLAVGTMLLTGPAVALKPSSNDPVKIPIMQSSDFDYIITVYGEVLKEAGYRVEYVNADYSATFPAVKSGDLHVTMAWDTSIDLINDAVNSRKAIRAGSSGVAISEGWWYPVYVEEVCPGLPNWEALKNPDCMEALSTAETEPMGRYVGAPAGWPVYVTERIEAFGLEMEEVKSGSPVTMMATMQGAIQRKEPVMGWGYYPHWLMASVEGRLVDFPDFEPECYEDPAWGSTPELYDCDYATGWVWKLMNTEFSLREPYATRILFLMSLDAKTVGKAMAKIDNEGQGLVDAAQEWMAANPDVWNVWLK
ncbi:MAG: ABC transporter [Thiotrichales bacterium]|nr:ABC transporter [Thiotrichales bacterium]|tara:strand:+ start:679 stop:1635 length:957 start_codon:yes stop_codon:yes gene_type:complete